MDKLIIKLGNPFKNEGYNPPTDPLNELSANVMQLRMFCYEHNHEVLIELGNYTYKVYLDHDICDLIEDELSKKIDDLENNQEIRLDISPDLSMVLSPEDSNVVCSIYEGFNTNKKEYILDKNHTIYSFRSLLLNLFELVLKYRSINLIRTTPWLVLNDHCAMRCIEGTDTNMISNRIAFIDKTPRVRIQPFSDISSDDTKWLEGPKGSGGIGNPDEELTYGFDPKSRSWCDNELIKMGYELVD